MSFMRRFNLNNQVETIRFNCNNLNQKAYLEKLTSNS